LHILAKGAVSIVLTTVLAINLLSAYPALERREARQFEATLLQSSSNRYYANSFMMSEKLLLFAKR